MRCGGGGAPWGWTLAPGLPTGLEGHSLAQLSPVVCLHGPVMTTVAGR